MPSPLFRNSNNRRQDEQQAAQQARSGSATSYGMRSIKSAVTAAVTKKLGDVGSLLSALFRPFGGSKSAVTEEIAAAVEQEMKRIGDLVPEPSRMPARPDIPAIGNRPVVENDDWKRFDNYNQPILEGPIMCPHSSNVYCFFYEHDQNGARSGSILVRFLGGTSQNRSGPGAMYRYFDCDYELFQEFKRAASAGKFVWDEFRQRGSVVAHKKNFEIVDIGNLPTVPRASVVKRSQSGSFFVPRTLNGQRSALPERRVGRGGKLPGWDKPRGSKPVHDHRLNRLQFIDSTGRRRG